MDLSQKDRKLLWAKAGNRCSYCFNGDKCDHRLVQDSGGKDVVVGEECHIIGEKPGSARYQAEYADRESYTNAILLCSVHHKIVDDTPEIHTVNALRQMKTDHESTVALLGRPAPDRLEISNSEFTADVSNADRAVGMEVNKPATITNVKSTVRVRGNVREAVGFSTNQGLTTGFRSCPACGKVVPFVSTGPVGGSATCPHCRAQVPLK